MSHGRTKSARVDAQTVTDLPNTMSLMNVPKYSDAVHRLNPLQDSLGAHMLAGGEPVEGGPSWWTVTQQDVGLRIGTFANLILIPLVAETHPVRPRTTDTGNPESPDLAALAINITHKAQVRMVMVSRHVQHIDTQPPHHLEGPVDAQQIVDSTRLSLLVPAPGARKVAHQQHAMELGPIGQRGEHLIEQVPTCVNVSDDTKNGTQRTGFICIRPYTVTITTS